MKKVTVWDGNGFKEIAIEEALRLEKEDKIQILSGKVVDGLSLRKRKEFTGYSTTVVEAGQYQDKSMDLATPQKPAQATPVKARRTHAEIRREKSTLKKITL